MSTTMVEMQEAQHRLSELVSLAQQGNEVILADGSTPVARLVAVVQDKSRIAGLNAGSMHMRDDFSELLPDNFWFGNA